MHMRDLELDLLRAFVAVADAGSFTAAADTVGRSQSAVSQKIRRLEDLIGHPIFDRNSRSLALTGAGGQLLIGARRLLDLNDDVIRSLHVPETTGRLRVGICEDFVPLQLSRLLARFLRLHPGVQLDVNTSLTHSLLREFEAGNLDLVIATRELKERGRVIWREPMVWFAASDFRLDPEQPVPLVLLQPPCSYRELMFTTLDAARQAWVTACTVSSLTGVQAAVAGGLGITLLGRSFIQDGMQIIDAPKHWPPLPMTEIIVLGEDTAEKSLARPLLEFLVEGMRMPSLPQSG
ncbi:LysR substrate-binding domain-containing protein [Bradyrhizobium japonicum]|nr:LysR substrate-binding domain-containing protein [Bradyrhizobium japonicum]MCD9105021.1 LysR substrate-binding domain-containing protein [Bradyrhizobium japonicum]MCD9255140.1 LysR substrate-binding domain-containing protein [Bradyrhizobium japonicum SEMIA 5079]MCD9819900.1 LysR substrate-binding domain-containing protein [Bradyrhizobium japonicum]MCD9892147.1 LysR substrate-binding domain-containing protein [Bradyrhizobium japonicum]MCD9907740.1 LysR substrate-binding domain-containing pro